MLKPIAFLLCFVLSKSMVSQKLFTGRVLNQKNVQIVNASIKIKDTSSGLVKYYAISDIAGQFSVKLPATLSKFIVECSFIGYRTTKFTLAYSGESANIIKRDITLLEDTATLAEINVRATPPVRISGDTTIFRTDAFKQGNESNVGDLLGNIPGFSVEDGRIKYNGRAISRVLIEDDDLFGLNYNTITQNLTRTPIQNIEKKNNYKDKTYLSNQIQSGKELIINLKFQNKYLFRILASNELGTDPRLSYYKMRQNIISLIPKIKFATTTNFNNTGNLGRDIIGAQAVIPELAAYKNDGINFDIKPRISPLIISQIPDISSGIIPRNKLVFNRSRLLTNNLLYKISRQMTLKSIVQYYSDSYFQNQDKTEIYNYSNSTFSINNRQFVNKNNKYFNISTEFIYTITPKSQIVYKVNYNTNNDLDSSADIRQQQNSINSSLENTMFKFQQQLGLSLAIDSSRILDFRIGHNSDSYYQSPFIKPAIIFKQFTEDSLFTNLRSTIQDKHNEYTVQLKVASHKNTRYSSLEFLWTTLNSRFRSLSELHEQNAVKSITNTRLNNDSYLSGSIGSIRYDINRLLFRKFNIQVSQKMEVGRIDVSNTGVLKISKKYSNYLPTVDIKYNPQRGQTINLQWTIRNKIPQIYDILPSYAITSGVDVIKGSDSFNIGLSRSLSLAYSFADPVKAKLTLFGLISHSRESILYLTNRNPSIYYTLSNKISFPDDGTTLSTFANMSKYISLIKSLLSMEVSSVNHSTYYSINSLVGSYRFSTFNPGIKIKTLLTDKLTVGLGTKLSYVKQVFDQGKIQETNSNIKTWVYSSEMIYRFFPSLTLSARNQLVSQIKLDKTQSASLLDASLNFVIRKDKLNLTLWAYNIFDNKKFTTSSFAQSSTVTQTIDMFPSYFLLQGVFEF